MPLYQYKCKNCGENTTQLAKYSERASRIPCPNCDGKADLVVISKSNFILHGNTWAKDSYGGNHE